MTSTTLAYQSGLRPLHELKLMQAGISQEVWEEASVYSADAAENIRIPEARDYFKSVEGKVVTFPAVVYTHRRWGDQRPVIQLNPDEPLEGRKYVQEAGMGSVIVVHKSQEDLIRSGEFDYLVPVEGTRQMLAAITVARAIFEAFGIRIAVIGLLGCANFVEPRPEDDSPRLMRKELTEILSLSVKAGAKVVLILDADWQTNRNVWNAADSFRSFAEVLGVNMTYAVIPGGAKTGFDDFIGAVDEPDRAAAFVRILELSKKSLGKPPAKAKTSKPRGGESTGEGSERRLAPQVDWRGARIYEVSEYTDYETGERKLIQTTIANFAARIVSSRTRRSKEMLEQQVVHKLEVKVNDFSTQLEDLEVVTIEVENSVLHKVDVWLSQLRDKQGFPIGTIVDRKTGPSLDQSIAAAIRANNPNQRAHEETYSHTGWVTDTEGESMYVSGNGSVDRHGAYIVPVVDAIQEGSNFVPQGNKLALVPQFASDDHKSEAREAVFEVINFLKMLQPAYAIMLMGYLVWTLTPFQSPLGSLILHGPKQSGKTASLAVIMAMLGGFKAGRDGFTSGAITDAALRDSAVSVSDLPLFFDDLGKAASMSESLSRVLDQVIRLANDGPGRAGFVRKVPNANSQWVLGAPIQTWPGLILSDERVPRLKEESAFQRTLSFLVTRETAWVEGADVKRYDFRADSNAKRAIAARLNLGFCIIFQSLVRDVWFGSSNGHVPDVATPQMARDGAAEYVSEIHLFNRDLLLGVGKLDDGDDDRALSLGAAIMSGWEFFNLAVSRLTDRTVSVFDDYNTGDYSRSMQPFEGMQALGSNQKRVAEVITGLIIAHNETVLPQATSVTTSTPDGFWNTFTSMLGSGELVIGGVTLAENPRGLEIGKQTQEKNEDGGLTSVILIDPLAVHRAMKAADRDYTLNAEMIKAYLLKREGAYTKQSRFKGQRFTFVFMPISNIFEELPEND